jgi:hypothetical protein
MLHHISLNARNPRNVADLLGRMWAATVLRAPTPPFPPNAWFVCHGDDRGCLIEVMPWGEVRDPNAPGGAGHDEHMRARTGWHALLSTSTPLEDIAEIAYQQGWRFDRTDAGLFRFVKVWVEDTTLVEFMSEAQAAEYTASFGGRGLKSLETKLRALEK